MKKPAFFVETRTLGALPDEDERAVVEQTLRRLSKREVSASRVGDVTGCADELGTHVLIAPQGEGAELRVAVRTRARAAGAIAGGVAASALVCVAVALVLRFSLMGVGAGTLVLFAALLFGVSRLVAVRMKRRAAKVADAIVESLPRIRVPVDEPCEEEPREARASATRRAAR